VPVIDKEKKDN